MKPYYEADGITIYHGDCREVDVSGVSAVVTDPPYGLEFMGKGWDKGVPGVEFWEHIRAACLPGAHLVAFGGTRTHHRLMCAIEDSGLEIRDCLMWLYGSGFPKSLDVSKAIDRQRDDHEARCRVALWLRPYVETVGFARVSEVFGFKDQTMARARWTSRSQPNTPTLEQWAKLKSLCGLPDNMDVEVWRLNGRKGQPGEAWEEREVTGKAYRLDRKEGVVNYGGGTPDGDYDLTAPATNAAKQWDGWGTALKPAWEPIVLARKPLPGTVAANVQEHGTGGINVEGCRVGMEEIETHSRGKNTAFPKRPGEQSVEESGRRKRQDVELGMAHQGRFPANVLLDEESAAMLDEQSGERMHGAGHARDANKGTHGGPSGMFGMGEPAMRFGDMGGASRFFKVVEWQQDELLFNRATAIFQAWNPSLVSTAESSSDLSSEVAVSVLSRAVVVASHGDNRLSDIRELGTVVTRSELKTLCVNVIAATLSFGNGQSSDLPPEKLIQCPKPVNGAATPRPTGTMTTTIGRVKSGGSAVVVTFVDTQSSTGVGEADYESRFRYCAKASRSERNTGDADNKHPTVKPLDLIMWLIRLTTPPRGLILDPFMGSGTTILAAQELNFPAIGIDLDEENCETAAKRLSQGVLKL